MKLAIKRCYCLVDENESIISSWDIIDERQNYIICSKKYKRGGLSLCCYKKDTETPLFEIDYVHSYELTKHCIIIARREYINEASYLVKYGVITYEGQTILTMDYYKIKSLKNENYFYVQKHQNGGIGLYNSFGKEILPINFDCFNEYSLCVSFEHDNKIGLYFFQ